MYDHRYCTYASCCFEKAYNYWDRIGDLLYSFYPALIGNIRSVDFVKIVDKIYVLGERDVDFIWLYDFKNNQYDELNNYRKNVVHYYQYESTYRDEHITNCAKLDIIEQLWTEKKGLPEYFKNHLDLANDGCVRAYSYLNKVIDFRNQNPTVLVPTPIQI
jgi:hypothetical protein